MSSLNPVESRTIKDFGDQWTTFTENKGFYGSVELLKDFLEPFIPIDKIKGKHIIDIGSGTGRIVNMLMNSGAGHVTAVEPSHCFEVLKKNTLRHSSCISYLNLRGDDIPPSLQADIAISIGVIHHIPDPYPTVRSIYDALRPSGMFLVWLYGRERNEAYLTLVLNLRKITTKLPHIILSLISWFFVAPLLSYVHLCRFFRFPLYAYARHVLAHMSIRQLHLIIYDQLNPVQAKYYTRNEAESLLNSVGFENVRSYHRHGYSWTVFGTKPNLK